MNKTNSTPQFTIGFNAPSLNQSQSVLNDENKIHNKKVSIAFSPTSQKIIDENPTIEDECSANNKNKINTSNFNNNLFITKESPSKNNNTNSSDAELKVFEI